MRRRLALAWHTWWWDHVRRYCMPCDTLTWRWRHRDCCARQRLATAPIAEWIAAHGHELADWQTDMLNRRQPEGPDPEPWP